MVDQYENTTSEKSKGDCGDSNKNCAFRLPYNCSTVTEHFDGNEISYSKANSSPAELQNRLEYFSDSKSDDEQLEDPHNFYLVQGLGNT